MADKDTGAKPICGHQIRLGPDRNAVAIGKIPESGLLLLLVETPIEGDLIGDCLYFEAALWSKPDFSDLIVATTVPCQMQSGKSENGVVVASEIPAAKQHGIKIGPDAGASMSQRAP